MTVLSLTLSHHLTSVQPCMWETRNIPLWRKKIHIYPPLVHTSVNLLIWESILKQTCLISEVSMLECRNARHKFSQHYIFRIYHHPARSSLCRPYTGRTVARLSNARLEWPTTTKGSSSKWMQFDETQELIPVSFGRVIFVCGRQRPII